MILNQKGTPDVGNLPHESLLDLLISHLMVPWAEAALNHHAPHLRALKQRLRSEDSCRDTRRALYRSLIQIAGEIPTEKSSTVYYVFSYMIGIEPSTYTMKDHKRVFDELAVMC